MTIIVWDGTTLAADKRATNGNHIRTVTKIFRAGPDELAGFVGGFTHGHMVLNWYMGGADPSKYPAKPAELDDAWLYVVHRTRAWRVYEAAIPVPFEDKVFAGGSGRDYAHGAMAMGADAVTAVRVASECCSSCGNGIDTLTFEVVQ